MKAAPNRRTLISDHVEADWGEGYDANAPFDHVLLPASGAHRPAKTATRAAPYTKSPPPSKRTKVSRQEVRFTPRSRKIVSEEQHSDESGSEQSVAQASRSGRRRRLDEPNLSRDVFAESSDEERKIPKPEGEVGRPRRGGYNLQQVLKWPTRDFEEVKVSGPLDALRMCSDYPYSRTSSNVW